MTDINTIAIEGRATADATVRMFQQGGMVTFSIAVNRSKKNADGSFVDEASFFDVIYNSQAAQNVAQYIKKGTHIFLSGYLKQDRWEQDGVKRSAVRIVATSLKFENKDTVPQQQMVQNNQPQVYQQPQQMAPQQVTPQSQYQQQVPQQQMIQSQYQQPMQQGITPPPQVMQQQQNPMAFPEDMPF